MNFYANLGAEVTKDLRRLAAPEGIWWMRRRGINSTPAPNSRGASVHAWQAHNNGGCSGAIERKDHMRILIISKMENAII